MNPEDFGITSREQTVMTFRPVAELAGVIRTLLIDEGFSTKMAEEIAGNVATCSLTSGQRRY